MSSTTRRRVSAPGKEAGRIGQRRAAAAEKVAAARQAEQRRRRVRWSAVALAAVVAVAGIAFLVARVGATSGQQGAATVGGDLHSIATVGDALYVGGHAAAAVSQDEGRTWRQIPSLDGADAMGWAVTKDAVLVGGHPGLYRSADGGLTFIRVTGAAAVPDVHALGGAGATVYLGSPQAGLLASTDGGQTWQVRNPEAGRSFMGSILVDPKNTDRLIAPDMSGGLTTSTDGGRTFNALGGPIGAMGAAWNPTDTSKIIATGMNGAAKSVDGGANWQEVDVPQGTSAVTYARDGRTLYAGALDGRTARTYRSANDGATWDATR